MWIGESETKRLTPKLDSAPTLDQREALQERQHPNPDDRWVEDEVVAPLEQDAFRAGVGDFRDPGSPSAFVLEKSSTRAKPQFLRRCEEECDVA